MANSQQTEIYPYKWADNALVYQPSKFDVELIDEGRCFEGKIPMTDNHRKLLLLLSKHKVNMYLLKLTRGLNGG